MKKNNPLVRRHFSGAFTREIQQSQELREYIAKIQLLDSHSERQLAMKARAGVNHSCPRKKSEQVQCGQAWPRCVYSPNLAPGGGEQNGDDPLNIADTVADPTADPEEESTTAFMVVQFYGSMARVSQHKLKAV